MSLLPLRGSRGGRNSWVQEIPQWQTQDLPISKIKAPSKKKIKSFLSLHHHTGGELRKFFLFVQDWSGFKGESAWTSMAPVALIFTSNDGLQLLFYQLLRGIGSPIKSLSLNLTPAFISSSTTFFGSLYSLRLLRSDACFILNIDWNQMHIKWRQF